MTHPATESGLFCQSCNAAFDLNAVRWRCDCGGLLDVRFASRFPLDRIKSRKPGMWRYREALPVGGKDDVITFGEGFTPLLEVCLEGRTVLMKQDHIFPTGSYKDRGASLLVSKARELGISRVVEDSSGNAGCAIAAYCAKADIECDIYVPAATSRAKLLQIECYGARLHQIAGSRQATAEATLEAAKTTYYASHSWNPFFLQGTKTIAFEICEQLGWQAPETIVVPAGNGTLLLGMFLGCHELQCAGLLRNVPKLIGVQALHCAPVAHAFEHGMTTVSEVAMAETIAEGIAIAKPVRGAQMLAAVRATGGEFMVVDEKEIRLAVDIMARNGIFIEPTAAAAVAAVRNYLPSAPAQERIVTVLTGHGLKSVEKLAGLRKSLPSA
jgi:threonine synthase